MCLRHRMPSTLFYAICEIYSGGKCLNPSRYAVIINQNDTSDVIVRNMHFKCYFLQLAER